MTGFPTRLGLGLLRERVVAHLRAALMSFESLGAGGWAERAHTRAARERRHARRFDRDSSCAPDTEETQIAYLARDAASNRDSAAQLFMSRRTVEHHMTRILANLGSLLAGWS